MPLKAKLTADEFAALDPALKPIYRDANGAFVLDAEGIEDVSGLKSALEKERADRKSYEKQLRDTIAKYEGIDPEVARQATAELQKLQDKKLIDEGKIDELVNARVERMRADHAAQVKALQSRQEELDTLVKSRESKLSEVLIDAALREAAIKNGARKTALEDVILRGRRVWKLEGDAPKPFDPVNGSIKFGKDGKSPMSIDEWLGALQQEAPHLFEASTGSGTEPGAPRQIGRTITITREQARDVQFYRQAAEQAAKSGAELVVAG